MNKKNIKHLSFRQRITIQHYLDTFPNIGASKLAQIAGVARNTIYYEISNYSEKCTSKAKCFNKNDNYSCPTLKRFPFVCNGCVNIRCSHRSRFYNAYNADKKAHDLLINARKDNKLRKRTIKVLNTSVCPLIKNGQSIHNALVNVNNCDVSEATIRRYIELGLVDAKRMDLPRANRFRVKKEYAYSTPPLDINVLYGRTYDDYKKYVEANPKAKIIQLDSVIGKKNDKYAILTIYFKNSKLQLGKIYHRKHGNIVNIMRQLYDLFKAQGIEPFNVVLTDNGSEFKKLHELELDEEGNRICHVFFCDPYRSCQKAECEKNHVFFRRIYPKGRSFKDLSQDNVDEIFSHINSYSRASLKNKSPYDLFSLEYNHIILTSLNIMKISLKDIKLIDYKRWDYK